MKWNSFENDMGDWLKEGLPDEQASMMAEHAASCMECAETVGLERMLVKALDRVPTPSRTPELWPKVAAQLDRPAPRPRFSFGIGKFAFAGTLAAGAVCALFMTHFIGSSSRPTIVAPGERNVLTMVAQMRELPEADPEALAPDAHLRRDLMLGRGDRP